MGLLLSTLNVGHGHLQLVLTADLPYHMVLFLTGSSNGLADDKTSFYKDFYWFHRI